MATFGITAALLQDRFMGERGITQAPRGSETCANLIEEFGAEVSQRLRAVNVDPDAITEAACPDSYAWCQATALYGIAAEFPRRMRWPESDNYATWDAKYQQRLSDLARNPNAVLKDSTASVQSSAGVRHVFV
jgi:hypothetical protein